MNFRTINELERAIKEIRSKTNSGGLGINLIVNKSNIKMQDQLKSCVKLKVDFIITSLGSPKEVIDDCKSNGIKVFCDVVNLEYAKKVELLGADAIIAVNNRAGGHLGPMSPEELIPLLIKHCNIPVISAGGVSDGKQLKQVLELGACGVSIGTPFIATHEADVSLEYKQAIVDYNAKDIVVTDRISGSKCTIINTPYVQSISLKANPIENFLFQNKWLKKYFKMFRWFNCLAYSTLAALIARILTFPSGTLSEVDYLIRIIVVILSIAIFYLTKKNLVYPTLFSVIILSFFSSYL